MAQLSFKAAGLAMGVTGTLAFAAPALAQQDTEAMQRQLDALRAQVERMEQQLDAQQSTTTADSGQATSETRELAEENRSLIDSIQNSQISGTLQLNASYNDWDQANKDKAGDMNFGKFVLALNGEHGNFLYGFDYRFYDGYQFLKSGWMGYQASENDTVKVGLVQTPFGNMDYGYLGWYGTLPYLSGFNDNQNAGIKWDHSQGAWDTSLAFFKSDQLGDGNEHYGANPVGNAPTDDDGNPTNQGNTAENQLAGRVAYTFGQGTDYTTEINFSAKGGQLYNNYTNDSGDNWQAAVGLNGSYGNWYTLLQATAYEYDAENPDDSGISDDVMQVGAFAFNYFIPAEGQMYSASLAYSMNVDWGDIDNLYFYNDFSYVSPEGDYSPSGDGGNVDDPMLNDLGMKVTAGPYYAWFSVIANKNALGYFGSPTDGDWHTSLQTNFGFNF
ncbi:MULTISPECIES: hypothetical protein [Chromohalobacter]|uniref:Porin n=1 Tax=Chromohalobacter moromii TaxID=2860329 RepID=A0A9X2WYP6_9GAMM|nr:hypothetical protein [Chromohalobacter sp. 11-W]MCK2045057.1 hypothetical protein [Chromohalobacter moromii]MCT8468044.1 hypothetical protein [Chromohalobacter canadensis]MCT8503794.1 hypothetical protein [Chromohalobacter moromii]